MVDQLRQQVDDLRLEDLLVIVELEPRRDLSRVFQIVGNDLVDGNLPDKGRKRRNRSASQGLAPEAAAAATVGLFGQFSGRCVHGSSFFPPSQVSETKYGCDAGKS